MDVGYIYGFGLAAHLPCRPSLLFGGVDLHRHDNHKPVIVIDSLLPVGPPFNAFQRQSKQARALCNVFFIVLCFNCASLAVEHRTLSIISLFPCITMHSIRTTLALPDP
jgi:hypothetical protein